MKTLILKGSPRINGDSMTLVNEITKHLIGEVIIIDTYNSGISHCKDCRSCWTKRGCVIEDDMQGVYKLLEEVDNVILASPIHFDELSGGVFNFASRLQAYYTSKNFRKDDECEIKMKNGVLVLSAGDEVGDLEGRAFRTANIIFRFMRVKLMGRVMSMKTNEIPAYKDLAALEAAKEIALKLNELYLG